MKTMDRSVDIKKDRRDGENTRQTRTGGILLEIDTPEGANTLAKKMQQAVAGKARLNRPERRTLVLLLGVPS